MSTGVAGPAFRRLRQIKIQGLFGYLDYLIPRFVTPETDRFLILYGENGAGKTTILRLVFALLYPVSGSGQKGFLADSMFRSIEVVFDDGTTVSAKRIGSALIGSYTISIEENGARRDFAINVSREGVVTMSSSPDIPALLVELANVCPPMSFLPDDRRFRSTAEPRVTRQTMEADEEGVRRRKPRESHHLSVGPVLERLNTWLRRRIIQASVIGEENAQSIYLRVVGEIAGVPGHYQYPENLSLRSLEQNIRSLAKRAEGFARYSLVSPVPYQRLFFSIEHAKSELAKETITRVLQPYVSGIEARLKALDESKAIISTLVETVNDFLVHKRIDFSPQRGLAFNTPNGDDLSPDLLSSGERQLLILLTNTILAWETGGIFLIDEPELSLNVTWQRKLVDALLRCSQHSKIQYIMASHSLEVVAQHLENVVKLGGE
jgi:energy-coupling factor transporter ATP-binding protein EcfA2